LVEAYQFTKCYPFKEFVDTFYSIKSNSSGIERFIAKSLLNNLYGFFGRNYDLIKTFSISNGSLPDYLAITEDIVLSIDQGINNSLIKIVDVNDSYQIKSNVAISSAITSYARVIMHPYLLFPFTLYSDTKGLIYD